MLVYLSTADRIIQYATCDLLDVKSLEYSTRFNVTCLLDLYEFAIKSRTAPA